MSYLKQHEYFRPLEMEMWMGYLCTEPFLSSYFTTHTLWKISTYLWLIILSTDPFLRNQIWLKWCPCSLSVSLCIPFVLNHFSNSQKILNEWYIIDILRFVISCSVIVIVCEGLNFIAWEKQQHHFIQGPKIMHGNKYYKNEHLLMQ